MSILLSHNNNHFRLRSFVRRDSRQTPAQMRAYIHFWPQFGLSVAQQPNYAQLFGRDGSRFLEIGFGSGESLLSLSKSHPECDFIGVETHKPGVGSLLLGIEREQLSNLRVYNQDVWDVLAITPAASFDGVCIFFPDPWQKRRHHARRLIQSEFVALLREKIKAGGFLHLATDWDDYAIHMMRVLSQDERLTNKAGVRQFAERSPYRPLVTKFERRALREGRKIWDLQFKLC